ncbi:MAG: Rho termination factor N-terminal domain-containing protein, partial [Actinomycetota bacterium]|nr:Rho termination factor N-terminal domain-containing protein [Actinomycetota bacterium]
QAARGGRAARRGGETAGGVDANASKAHLLDLAKRMGVRGRSKMTKGELVEALRKANDAATARARSES